MADENNPDPYRPITEVEWRTAMSQLNGRGNISVQAGVTQMDRLGEALLSLGGIFQSAYDPRNHAVRNVPLARAYSYEDFIQGIRQAFPQYNEVLKENPQLTLQMANDVLAAARAIEQNRSAIQAMGEGNNLARTKVMAPHALAMGMIDQDLHDRIMKLDQPDPDIGSEVLARYNEYVERHPDVGLNSARLYRNMFNEPERIVALGGVNAARPVPETAPASAVVAPAVVEAPAEPKPEPVAPDSAARPAPAARGEQPALVIQIQTAEDIAAARELLQQRGYNPGTTQDQLTAAVRTAVADVQAYNRSQNTNLAWPGRGVSQTDLVRGLRVVPEAFLAERRNERPEAPAVVEAPAEPKPEPVAPDSAARPAPAARGEQPALVIQIQTAEDIAAARELLQQRGYNPGTTQDQLTAAVRTAVADVQAYNRSQNTNLAWPGRGVSQTDLVRGLRVVPEAFLAERRNERPEAPAADGPAPAEPGYTISIPPERAVEAQELVVRYGQNIGPSGADGNWGPRSDAAARALMAEIIAYQRANGRPNYAVGNGLSYGKLTIAINDMPEAWREERAAGGDERIAEARRAAEAARAVRQNRDRSSAGVGGGTAAPPPTPAATKVDATVVDAAQVQSDRDVSRTGATTVPGIGVPPVGGVVAGGRVAGLTAAAAATEAVRQGNAAGNGQGNNAGARTGDVTGQGSPGAAGRQQGSLALTPAQVEAGQGRINDWLINLHASDPATFSRIMGEAEEAARRHGTPYPEGRHSLEPGELPINKDGKYGPITHYMFEQVGPRIGLSEYIAEGAQPGFGRVRREPEIHFKSEEARAQFVQNVMATPVREVPVPAAPTAAEIQERAEGPRPAAPAAEPAVPQHALAQNLNRLNQIADANRLTRGGGARQGQELLQIINNEVGTTLIDARARGALSPELAQIEQRFNASTGPFDQVSAKQLLADMNTLMAQNPPLIPNERLDAINGVADAYLDEHHPAPPLTSRAIVNAELAAQVRANPEQPVNLGQIEDAQGHKHEVFLAVNRKAPAGQDPQFIEHEGKQLLYWVDDKGQARYFTGNDPHQEVRVRSQEADDFGIQKSPRRGVLHTLAAPVRFAGRVVGVLNNPEQAISDASDTITGAAVDAALGDKKDDVDAAVDQVNQGVGVVNNGIDEVNRTTHPNGNGFMPTGTPTRQEFLQQQRDPFGVNAGTPNFTNPQLSGIMEGLQGVQLAGTDVRAMTPAEAEAAIASFNRLAQQSADGQLAVTGERRVNTNQLG